MTKRDRQRGALRRWEQRVLKINRFLAFRPPVRIRTVEDRATYDLFFREYRNTLDQPERADFDMNMGPDEKFMRIHTWVTGKAGVALAQIVSLRTKLGIQEEAA